MTQCDRYTPLGFTIEGIMKPPSLPSKSSIAKCSCFDEMIDGACTEHGLKRKYSEAQLEELKKTDYDEYCLVVTGELEAAKRYAYYYFNSPEARRADELNVKFSDANPVFLRSSYKPLRFSSSNFGSFEVLASGHSEPSDVPIEVMLGFKS